MRNVLRVGLVGIGLMAAASGQSTPRLVIVVGQPDDPRVVQQRAALQADAAALRERDVVVQQITPEAARHDRPEWRVTPQADFVVLLVGKDGGVKLRRAAPVAPSEITQLIDTMPMRRQEMQGR